MTLTTNILAYWKFSEGSGSSVADATGNGNGMTLVASPTWGTGIIGSDVTFNGTSQYGTVTETAAFHLQAVAFSISFWINSSFIISAPFVRILSWYDGTRAIELGISGNNSTKQGFYIGRSDSTTAKAGSTINYTLSTWHHVVATFDGSTTWKLYVDGVEDDANSAGFTGLAFFSSNSTTIYFAQRGDAARFLPGALDEIGIWSRELTSAEVTSLYASGSGLQYPFGVGGTATTAFRKTLSGVGTGVGKRQVMH